MQLTPKVVCEQRYTHNTLTVKNDARRPVKNLILMSRVLGLEPQVLVNITGRVACVPLHLPQLSMFSQGGLMIRPSCASMA